MIASDYAGKSTVELRKIARETGLAKGAAVASARKEDLLALLTGATTALEAPKLVPLPQPPARPVRAALPSPEVEIKLTAANPTEQRILEYLRQNASSVLAQRINAGTKTLKGAVDYAKGEAKKLASGSSCVCVDDDTVFGWVIHFFEEDHIKEGTTAAPVTAPKKKALRVPGGVKQAELAPAPVPEPEPVLEPEPAPAAAPTPVEPEGEQQLDMFASLLQEGTK